MKTLTLELPDRLDFLKGNKALEIGYPWITMGSILALEEWIKPEFSVLEFGSGGSTIFFAKRCKLVKSYETNLLWYNKVKTIIDDYSNVSICFGNMNNFIESINNDNNLYDIVLIDSDEKLTDRKQLANISLKKINLYGFIIIDNYLRWGMNRFKPKGFRMFTFDDIRWNGKGTRIFQRRE